MPSSADIAAQVRAALALSEPDLDTSIGSIMGKLIDAFSPPVAAAFNDQHLSTYQYDIDSKAGGDLESFVRVVGGLDRKAARSAVGTVTFGRSTKAAKTGPVRIPVGTQVMSNTNPVIYVRTVAAAVMTVNQTSIDVPVQALVAGARGNVAAGTLTQLASDVPGISSTTINVAALTNGQDAESDVTLRERWKRTALRNLAGTTQMYRAMAAQADSSVTSINVIGPKKTWRDRISISGGVSPTINYGAPEYIYSTGVFVGADLGSSDLLARGTDYTVTINNTPGSVGFTISAVAGGNMPDGDYDIQYDYVPTYSRNNPFGTRFGENAYVNNRIDVWCNGSMPTSVTQACKFRTVSDQRFTGTSGDDLYRLDFTTLDGTHPSVNDIFTPLGFGPIISVPNSLVIGSTTYTEGTHYDVVHRSTAFGYGPNSQFGLVWYAAGAIPTAGAPFAIEYVYNAVPATIQHNVQNQWRLLGTDCMYHAGIPVLYKFNLAVAYLRGYDTGTVNTAIDAALSALLAPLGFDSALQVSDVLQAVHNVPGVDNVRMLNSTDDGASYAIERMSAVSGTSLGVIASGGRAIDIYFDDAHYPVFHSSRIMIKTRSNFGVS